MERICRYLNSIDTGIFIFILLIVNCMTPVLFGNEEHYLGLAKAFTDPTWLPGSFTFSEAPGARIVFQHITGFFLNYFTIPQVALGGRILCFAGFALVLPPLFKKLTLSNISLLFIFQGGIFLVQLFMGFPFQALFGQEWIFFAFEAKTVSYIFLFAALNALLNRRFIPGAVFAAIALLFHILVGIWFGAAVFIYMIAKKEDIGNLLKAGGIFISLSAPFAVYLLLSGSLGGSGGEFALSPDWIYSFFRHPHHVAPFASTAVFFQYLPGVIVGGIFFIALIKNKDKTASSPLQDISVFNTVLWGILLANFALSFFDTTGALLKYYPFRLGSLAFFLLLTQLVMWHKESLLGRKWPPRLFQIGLIVLVCMTTGAFVKNSLHFILYRDEPALIDLALFCKRETPEHAVFLNWDDPGWTKHLGTQKNTFLSFPRLAERDFYVIYKFPPAGGQRILEWYNRGMAFLDVWKGEQTINNLPVDYIISRSEIVSPFINEIYRNEGYYLYRKK